MAPFDHKLNILSLIFPMKSSFFLFVCDRKRMWYFRLKKWWNFTKFDDCGHFYFVCTSFRRSNRLQIFCSPKNQPDSYQDVFCFIVFFPLIFLCFFNRKIHLLLMSLWMGQKRWRCELWYDLRFGRSDARHVNVWQWFLVFCFLHLNSCFVHEKWYLCDWRFLFLFEFE